jgi:hypothetical protein
LPKKALEFLGALRESSAFSAVKAFLLLLCRDVADSTKEAANRGARSPKLRRDETNNGGGTADPVLLGLRPLGILCVLCG